MKYEANLICTLATASIVSVCSLSFVRHDTYLGKTRFVSRSLSLVLLPLARQSATEIDIDFLKEN